jgi:hypothetical protein
LCGKSIKMMVDYGYGKQLMYGKTEVCGKFDLSALTSDSRSPASSASSLLLASSTLTDGRPSPHCISDCGSLRLSSNSSTGSASTSCASNQVMTTSHSLSAITQQPSVLHSPASSLETCVVSTSMHSSQMSASGVNALSHSNINNANLANNSKQKRHRTRFTPAQLQELEVIMLAHA